MIKANKVIPPQSVSNKCGECKFDLSKILLCYLDMSVHCTARMKGGVVIC